MNKNELWFKEVTYKGYTICFNFYRSNEYTVQYCGDDCWFDSMEQAEKFIDSLVD